MSANVEEQRRLPQAAHGERHQLGAGLAPCYADEVDREQGNAGDLVCTRSLTTNPPSPKKMMHFACPNGASLSPRSVTKKQERRVIGTRLQRQHSAPQNSNDGGA